MPRVHKKFYCMADPRPLKIQAFKQPHSSCGLDNYNVVDPRSEASTNSSMNCHSPQKQPCRMTSSSEETDLFLHSKILTRGQWILHLWPCSKLCFKKRQIIQDNCNAIRQLCLPGGVLCFRAGYVVLPSYVGWWALSQLQSVGSIFWAS